MVFLPLHHVKEFIAYGGAGMLHGSVGTVPYGNAPCGTLQSLTCHTGDGRENKRDYGKNGIGGVVG